MGNYGQLSLEERCTIARLQQAGQSCRQIAAAMDRSASAICRELKRNAGAQLGYQPAYAEEQTWARRWRGSRLARQPELRERVLQRLAKGQSPEQVAGRLRLEQGRAVLPPNPSTVSFMRRFGVMATPTGATICRDANTNAAIVVQRETALRCG